MLRQRLLPPCAYQGGKRRQAPEIVRHMGAHAARGVPFVELCCGGAAVSLELISRGKPPELVTLVDAGPWGLFWKAIGEGSFCIQRFGRFISDLPRESAEVVVWMREKSSAYTPASEVPYLFPLLQAASFGGAPIGWKQGFWIKAGGWALEGSNVNHRTIFGVVFRRVERLLGAVRGLRVACGDVREIEPAADSVVYFDPPYRDTVGYSDSVDGSHAVNLRVPCYVSERTPLNPSARRIISRLGSGLNAASSRDDSEYLSLFNAEWTTPEPVVERVEQICLL